MNQEKNEQILSEQLDIIKKKYNITETIISTTDPEEVQKFSNNLVEAEIVGKVTRFDKKNRKIFWVWTEESQKEYKCQVDFFCPVREGDALHGYVEYEDISGQEPFLKFKNHPYVKMAMDKQSLLECFQKVLRGTGFGNIKSNQLYDKLLDLSTDDSRKNNNENNIFTSSTTATSSTNYNPIIGYLSNLAHIYYREKDDVLVKIFNPLLNQTQGEMLLRWWYKNRNLRKLYLLGLTKKEIYACEGMNSDQIYEKCLQNPFTVVPIPINKCYEIWRRIGKYYTGEQERCGVIARKLYEHNLEKSWTGSPSKNIAGQFPDVGKMMPSLKKDYGVIGELFTIYLEYPYIVETAVAMKINNFIKIKNECKTDDPLFKRKNLNMEQKIAIQGALDNSISIITGPAGSGKTTIIDEIIYNLETRNIGYLIASFTGKAVARIREIIDKKSPGTMHSLIMRKNMIAPFKYLIIDETSMVTTELFYKFGEAFQWNFYPIFIGDENQLQPIGWGNLFQQLLDCKKIPTFRLVENHRSKNESGTDNGILINATNMIKYQEKITDYDPEGYIEPFEFNGAFSNFKIINGNIDLVELIIKKMYGASMKSDQLTVITPYTKYLNQLNNIYQQIYNDGHKCVSDCKGKIWMIGDRVMMSENNYDINIMNGEEGVIEDLIDNTDGKNDGEVIVKFRDGEQYNFKLYYSDQEEEEEDFSFSSHPKEKLTVKLLINSFAVTIHKSQGSEWEFVILYIPYNNNNENNASSSGYKGNSFLNRNLVYTAITRAKKAIWIVVENEKSLNTSAITNPPYRCDNLSKRILTLSDCRTSSNKTLDS